MKTLTSLRANVIGLITILIIFGPGLYRFVAVSFSADRANDDSRQVTWPLLRFGDPDLFNPDPIADYYLENQLPLGYSLIVGGLAHFIDAVPLLTLVGLLSLTIAACFAFLTGKFIAGILGGWICVALVLATDTILFQTAGGLPRATGFALGSVVLYGFLCGRPLFTASASVLGALFWYPIGVISGALYALQLLTPNRLFGWEYTRSFLIRVFMVFAVGSLAVGLVAPKIFTDNRWGPVVSNTSEKWPEAGSRGRFYNWPENQLGIGRPLDTAKLAVESGFINRYAPWLAGAHSATALQTTLARLLSCALLLALAFLSLKDWTARRLLSIIAVSICLYVAAIIFAPLLYAPSRFVMSIVPGTFILTFAYMTFKLGVSLSKSQQWMRPAYAQLVLATLVILVLAGRPSDQGYEDVNLTPPDKGLLDFLGTLPKDSVIAGWPKGVLDNVPLFSRRRVLLSYETHLPFHEEYLREMRPKAKAVINAWFSADTQAVHDLIERYGVTHFVIDRDKAAAGKLWYFEPFDAYIDKKYARLKNREKWIESPPSNSVVFSNERAVVVDLGRLFPLDSGGGDLSAEQTSR